MTTVLSYFKNISKLRLFKSYIESQNINYPLSNIVFENSKVSLFFTGVLNSIEKDEVDVIVLNYQDDLTVLPINVVTLNTKSSRISSITYALVAEFSYRGTLNEDPFDEIRVYSYRESNTSSIYSLRLVDSTNQIIIATLNNLDNLVRESFNLTVPVNLLSENDTVFELQCKLNSATVTPVNVSIIEQNYYD